MSKRGRDGKSVHTGKSQKKSHKGASQAESKPQSLFSQFGAAPPSQMRMQAAAGALVHSCDVIPTTLSLNSTTATAEVLNIPLEGDSFYQRSRRIRMKSVQIRACVIPNPAATGIATHTRARMLLVYDRNCNGAFPALSDIIASYNNAGTISTTVFDGLNMNNRERFLILRDNFVQLPPIGAAGATPASDVLTYTGSNDRGDGDSQGMLAFTWYVKLAGLTTQYKANAGNIGDISTGSLLLVVWGDDPGAAQGYNVRYSARLKYYTD